MQTFSTTDASQAVNAAQRTPVLLQEQNQEYAVLMSVEQYEKLRGVRMENFDRIASEIEVEAAARGLTEEKLAGLLSDVS